MNLSGTTHLKLESRPAFRNFPDSANLEDKKGRFESQLPDLSFAFMSDFFKKRIEIFHQSQFWGCSTKHDKGEHGISWSVFCCLCVFGNFHHLDLFSLNLDLVYGGIRRTELAAYNLQSKMPQSALCVTQMQSYNLLTKVIR